MAEVNGVSAHTDPEVLGLLALGEEVGGADERAHLESCQPCARELSELRRLAVLGRSVGPEPVLADPDHRVWALIRDELGFDPTLEPPTHRSLFLPSDDLVPPAPRPVEHRQPAPSASFRTGLLERFGRVWAKISSGTDAGRGQVVARAELAGAGPRWDDSQGSARLEVDDDGSRTLRLSLEADLPETGLRYVWLLDRADPTRMQPIGQLGTLSGFWSIGPAVDLSTYDLVDVSQQAVGSVLHSGDSIVRGQLTPA